MILKTVYNLTIIGIWLIFVWQFCSQVALVFICFFNDKISLAFFHMGIAIILSLICLLLSKFTVSIK
jgi:hypothetical protein